MHVENKSRNIVHASKLAKELFQSLCIKLPDETPQRFVKMLSDLTEYQNISNSEIADIANKIFEVDAPKNSKNMVMIRDIDAFSLCEHHIALMYDMKVSVAYIPKNFVLGLSKVVRVVDMVCKRLQLQEKIADDIIDIMSILTKGSDIAVHIKAKHSCITARGINNLSSETVTTNFSGLFLRDESLKSSFLSNLS